MTRETRNLLLIGLAAGLCGLAAAFIAKGPGPLWRTELGQRALQAAIQKSAPDGMRVAQRDHLLPPIQVSTLEGQRLALPLPVGRPVLINVWATWCPPCVKEMPELADFAQAEGAQGVQVIGIALDETEAVRAWLAQRPSPYPHYRDDAGDRDAGVALGNPAGVLPYSILIDARGIVRRQRVGPFASASEIADWSHTDPDGRQ